MRGKWVLHLALCATVLSTALASAQCKPGSPSGHYQGEATSAEAGKLDISLNLVCAKETYAGSLDTPLGTYTVTGGSYENGMLKLQLERAGVAGITITANASVDDLTGSFTSGDDKGPVALHRAGDALPLQATTRESISLTPQQWREDLAYLVRELPARHPDAFANTPREKFEAAAADLGRNIDHLNADQIYVGFDHLANLIGDAHTFVEFPPDDANLPLDARHFGSDLRIVAVTAGYERALGTRVIAIGDTPIAKARQLATTLTPVAETEGLKETRVDSFLTTGMALHGLGITPDRNSARYLLATDAGQRITVDFKALAPDVQPKWISVRSHLPLSAQPVKESAACSYLDAARTLYCNVRRIRELSKPSKKMLEMLRRERPEKVVIDLRHNNGGDFNEGLKYLIEPLRKDKDINQRGRLFVLIGADTFSAAMSNAAQFRSMTNALLVGQPVGERPNSWQEPRQFKLPNSHWVVRYSTQFYKFATTDNIVAPDKEITPTWEDFVNGRDPVLDWVLQYKQ